MASRNTICHVIYRLDYGGLENGLVNLINGLSDEDWQHVIITLDGYTDYVNRLPKSTIVVDLDKRPGNDFGLYLRLWKAFRKFRPTIVHTRNLATLEAQIPAFFAGVPQRVHGEHGRDVHDLDNKSSKYRLLRKILSVFVHRYTSVSKELEDYLVDEVKIDRNRITRICNGVDTQKFAPILQTNVVDLPSPFKSGNRLIFGSVGRMQEVKDQTTLAKAFIELVNSIPNGKEKFGLILVGDGPLRDKVRAIVNEAELNEIVWLPGGRDDTQAFYRLFDVFVLPSLAEGISNTILEAMASGLPVVATAVGGNAELVEHNVTGRLIQRRDVDAMCAEMRRLADSEELRKNYATNGRKRAYNEFSLDVMLLAYEGVYKDLVGSKSSIAKN